MSRSTPRILALAALVAAATLVPATHADAQPRTAAPAVVTPAWLASQLRDPNLVILHVGNAASYDSAHIEGAHLAPLSAFDAPRTATMSESMMGAMPALTLELPPSDSLSATLSRFGVTRASRIIVYATNNIAAATRVVLTLHHAGLGDATSLLDGGLAGWARAGNATTSARTAARTGVPIPLTPIPFTVNADWVREHGGDRGVRVVDARAATFYDGTQESGPTDARRRGHIPGAANIPFTSVFTERNELLPSDSLRAIFRRAGVQPGDTVVGYCHIGQQATAMLFAARSLGHPIKLYDGSFEDWARRQLPVVAKE